MTDRIVIQISLILLTLLSAFTPYYIRKNDVFGVFLPNSAVDEKRIKGYRKKYCFITLFVGLVFNFLYFRTSSMQPLQDVSSQWFIAALFLTESVLYLIFHFKIKALKASGKIEYRVDEKITIDLSPEPQLLSRFWFIPHVLVIVVSIMVSFLCYRDLPNQIAVRFAASGAVTYANKSFLSVFGLNLVQCAMLVMFIILMMLLQKSKKVISAKRSEQQRKASLIFKRSWSVFLSVMSFFTVLLMSVIQLVTFEFLSVCAIDLYTSAYSICLFIWMLFLVIKMGQGGSRLIHESADEKEIDAREDDSYWKYGIFYFNSEDPSLMVEKRFGLGWTFNFARPMIYVIFAGVLLLALTSVFIGYLL